MKNYMKVSLEKNTPRVELHDKLSLTGAEISINTLPAGECVPFIHSHKQNEEVYYILGQVINEVINVKEENLQMAVLGTEKEKSGLNAGRAIA